MIGKRWALSTRYILTDKSDIYTNADFTNGIDVTGCVAIHRRAKNCELSLCSALTKYGRKRGSGKKWRGGTKASICNKIGLKRTQAAIPTEIGKENEPGKNVVLIVVSYSKYYSVSLSRWEILFFCRNLLFSVGLNVVATSLFLTQLFTYMRNVAMSRTGQKDKSERKQRCTGKKRRYVGAQDERESVSEAVEECL